MDASACGEAEKSDGELLAKATMLRDEATELLDECGLLSVISNHGRTRVIGSYDLDLMTWRDLDISVKLPGERDVATFFRIGNAIVNRFETIRASYSNKFLGTDQVFKSGLYWGIRLLHREQTWKVDLWGFGEEEYAEKMGAFERLRQSLVSADRTAVLRVKDVVCRWEQYRYSVYSTHIYDAVVGGVTTVDEFRDWLRAHVPEAFAETSRG